MLRFSRILIRSWCIHVRSSRIPIRYVFMYDAHAFLCNFDAFMYESRAFWYNLEHSYTAPMRNLDAFKHKIIGDSSISENNFLHYFVRSQWRAMRATARALLFSLLLCLFLCLFLRAISSVVQQFYSLFISCHNPRKSYHDTWHPTWLPGTGYG